jgi:hypothetical protein
MPRAEHNIKRKSTSAHINSVETIEKGNVALVESINEITQNEQKKGSSIGKYVTKEN